MTRPPRRSPLFPNTPLSRSPFQRVVIDRHKHDWHARADVLESAHRLLRTHGEDQVAFRVDQLARKLRKMIGDFGRTDRKSTRLNSSHLVISYAVFCLKKKNK